MPIDVLSRSGSRRFEDRHESAERESVNAELACRRIARECAAPTLPTAALRWDLHNQSAETPGALTPTNAQGLTRAWLRRHHAARAAFRGRAGLLHAIKAA